MTGVRGRMGLGSFITETQKGQTALERRGPGQSTRIPPRGIVAFAGDVPPKGWLLCDGAAHSREGYARLFELIGTDFGAGDGTTTFNVPNIPPLVAGVNWIIKV